MPVSPDTEWVLVTCGLIAHADDTLDGNEVERLMQMIDEHIPAEDYADWLALIGDKQALEARYAELPDPPAAQHRVVLEEAWTMAMVDGERNTAELVVLARLAERLGVAPMQLEFWREAWTLAERQFAVCVAELCALCLGGGEALFEPDHSPYLDLIERLPTSTEERGRLRGFATSTPTDGDALSRSLAALPRTRRIQAFRLVAPLVRSSVDAEAAGERFASTARAAGLLDVDALHR